MLELRSLAHLVLYAEESDLAVHVHVSQVSEVRIAQTQTQTQGRVVPLVRASVLDLERDREAGLD